MGLISFGHHSQTGSYTLPDVAANLEQSRLEVKRLRLATEQARLELERDRLILEREQFAVTNSEESKNFAKAQLLRELASASGDNNSDRRKLVRKSANLIMGNNFFYDEDINID